MLLRLRARALSVHQAKIVSMSGTSQQDLDGVGTALDPDDLDAVCEAFASASE